MITGIENEQCNSRFQVQLENTESGLWLATNPNIATHGVGETLESAIDDFMSMLFDLYEELLDSEDVLAPHLLDELDYLRYSVINKQ